ncbi:FecR family protein [Solimonas variicoloris]|uniref:FecR family protein n=1 Tax=Solimonas variicoloris TaxID=254408 RepID=UPI0003655F7D|nr:FecR domain-containing protein [Solimonas variicoloris]
MRHLPALFAACALAWLAPAIAAVPATPSANAAPAAGEIVLLTGHGTALSPDGGNVRDLAKGDKVYAGDVVNAGPNSYINVRFSDGAFVLLRPNSRLAIEAYAYAGPAPDAAAKADTPPAATPPVPAAAPAATAPSSGGVQRAFLRLLKGGLRTVSGLIGKADPEEYRVTTPVATIGIRGTDYYAYLCDLACASDPIIVQSLELLHLEQGVALGATLNGVLAGSIAVTNAAGHTEILGNGQYLLTLSDGRQIRLPEEPRFLRVTPFPNPQTMCP